MWSQSLWELEYVHVRIKFLGRVLSFTLINVLSALRSNQHNSVPLELLWPALSTILLCFWWTNVMSCICVHCRSLIRGKSIPLSFLSFEWLSLLLRKHRINKSQKHFSKQRTSLQQPAAPLLFLLHASRRRPHLPQMHPRKHSSSSPGEGVDAPDLVPSPTTGSSTPGSTLFQRKWPNCVPKKGQLIQHRIKTAVGVRHAGMERALRAAASTETFKARGSVRAPW